MRDVVITTGVYGRRDEKGRVLPVAKGERVTLPDEGERIFGVAACGRFYDRPGDSAQHTDDHVCGNDRVFDDYAIYGGGHPGDSDGSGSDRL